MVGCEAEIDLAAIGHNVSALRRLRAAEVMAVVKADGYGHGLVPVARAALAGGATWLGTAYLPEALALRAAGITAPVLCWLPRPGEDLAPAVRAGVDVSVSDRWVLDELLAAARRTGRAARVHLKVDTGCARAGATPARWPELVLAAGKSAGDELDVVGVWSHLANADQPGHPSTDRQVALFAEALEVAAAHGITPRLRHLANSAAALSVPAAAYDLVRPGIAIYGVNPLPGPSPVDLVPAMTLRAPVMLARQVAAGTPVSYGHEYVTTRETTLALVAAGYADGVPRAAGNRAEVLLAGRRRRISGRVCMDQFVLDVPDAPVLAGDPVVLFGPGTGGEPTLVELAEAVGTIPNELLTRLGPRVRRVYR
ncbi:alanine racemase [Micromonospora halophytica]|uniref:Alanine racemase n=1 Tax=Micromonospora halophytica TaxID=47864 RepID=A0A1C5I7V2_9ACTN|nr:alanine racemase [Micromonospora halophytica]SCG54277.1 alanine racemase [Micromonospora halophytica]